MRSRASSSAGPPRVASQASRHRRHPASRSAAPPAATPRPWRRPPPPASGRFPGEERRRPWPVAPGTSEPRPPRQRRSGSPPGQDAGGARVAGRPGGILAASRHRSRFGQGGPAGRHCPRGVGRERKATGKATATRAPRQSGPMAESRGGGPRRWLLTVLAAVAAGGLLLAVLLARSHGALAASGTAGGGRLPASSAGAAAAGQQAAQDSRSTAAAGGAAAAQAGGATAAAGASTGASTGTPALAGTSAPAGSSAFAGPPTQPGAASAAERLRVKVLSVWPHDPTSYTQGLVWDRGTLYESAGLYGRSSLRQVDPRTGEVLRRLDVPPGFFAEGLAQVGERLVQLTWKEGVAFVYDVRSFERVGELHYQGEGWGLCDDGRRLVMSDGSDRLSFRDRQTFALLGGVDVRLDGRPARQLNELECVGGAVYANVWMTDEILRIDPAGGRVGEHDFAAAALDRIRAGSSEELKTRSRIRRIGEQFYHAILPHDRVADDRRHGLVQIEPIRPGQGNHDMVERRS